MNRIFFASNHVADVRVINANYSNNVASMYNFFFLLTQVVEGEKLFDVCRETGTVIFYNHDRLALVQGSREKASNTNTAHKTGVVDRANLQGDRSFGVTVRAWNFF